MQLIFNLLNRTTDEQAISLANLNVLTGAHQCDQVWKHFNFLATYFNFLAIFEGLLRIEQNFVPTLANLLRY